MDTSGSSMTFGSLLNKQIQVIEAIEQVLPKYKKLALVKRTTITIQRRMGELQQLLPQLRNYHAELMYTAEESDKDNNYSVEDKYSRCIQIYDETIETLEDALVSIASTSTVPAEAAPGSNSIPIKVQLCVVPLPELKMPTFSGDVTKWKEFRDRFTAVVISDTRLRDVDRMKYLRTSLSGSACRTIAHLKISDDNFKDAWTTVCDKFQNLRELIQSRFDIFHAVTNILANSLIKLYSLQEVIKSTPRSLRGFGRQVAGWSDLYVDCILRKFDSESRMLLADRITNDKEPITLTQIKDFIEHRIQVVQSGKSKPVKTIESGRIAKNSNKSEFKAMHNVVSSSNKCIMCQNPHPLYRCFKFQALSVDDRRKLVNEKRCCWLCLSGGHTVRNCTSSYKCRKCSRRHHLLLHEETKPIRHEVSKSNSVSLTTDEKVVSHVTTSVTHSGFAVLLATAWVKIYHPDGRSTTVRTLLDQGSEATLLSERAVQLLRLPRHNCSTRISGVGGINCISRYATRVGVGHRLSDKPIQFTNAVILPSLTQVQPGQTTRINEWRHLKGLPLADPDIAGVQSIDIILGSDLYSSFLRNGVRRGRRDMPIAQNTILGWIVSGRYKTDSETSTLTVHATRLDRINDDLQRFWQVEELPNERFLTPHEQECEEHFCRTVTRTENGRYVVRLPFRSNFNGDIENSRCQTLQCLNAMERRLERDVSRATSYREFMNEYESLGHMTRVEPSNVKDGNNNFYIPHHAVFRTIDEISKIRVVFNASKRTAQGISLNDVLHIGPRLQVDLPAIILKWRFHKFVLTADITKMYRQILVNSQDVDYQQIFWRNSPSEVISVYRLLTVTYGALFSTSYT